MLIAPRFLAPGAVNSSLEGRARPFLDQGQQHDREGRLAAAIGSYHSAIAVAESERDDATLAEALRLLAIAHHRLNERETARSLCQRSQDVASRLRDTSLTALAMNTLAAFDLSDGAIDAARDRFESILELAVGDPQLRGRVEQNLGIIANIHGDFPRAEQHYRRSLEAFATASDQRGRAMVYNSLGMISADQQAWDAADEYFNRSVELAAQIGDLHVRGMVLLNQTEVHLAKGRLEAAQRNAEESLRIFDSLGIKENKADAYRTLGVVYRATGRMTLAEARLRHAIDLAARSGSTLAEAEASRELGLLHRDLGRNQDALKLLNTSHRLFKRLDARADLVEVASRTHELESTFLSIVLEWGQSIESADSYTHGHCQRVAQYAIGVSREMKLGDAELTTIRLGAYLHDLGKVNVPHEILNKPGKLTSEEFEVLKRHPIDGVEMLKGIEFPWDILPIVRWHHERLDGSGYPDGLVGDRIPVHAQIICIADVYDALTTTRSYRGAMPAEKALSVMTESRDWWRPDVFGAFMRAERVFRREASEESREAPEVSVDHASIPTDL